MIQFPIIPAEDLVLPGEDLAAFEQLRAGLHEQYAAQTPTELFLVEEVVQNTWRIRRFRIMETASLQSPAPEIRSLALIQRALAAAERACHRALAALTKLQNAKQRPALKQPELSPGLAALAEELDRELSPSPADFERLRAAKEKLYPGRFAASSASASATASHSAASEYTSQSRANRAASALPPVRSSDRPPAA